MVPWIYKARQSELHLHSNPILNPFRPQPLAPLTCLSYCVFGSCQLAQVVLAPLVDMEDLVSEHAHDSRTLASAYRHHAKANDLQPVPVKQPPLQPPPLLSSGTSPPLQYKMPPPTQHTLMTNPLAQRRSDVITMGESQRDHDHRGKPIRLGINPKCP